MSGVILCIMFSQREIPSLSLIKDEMEMISGIKIDIQRTEPIESQGVAYYFYSIRTDPSISKSCYFEIEKPDTIIVSLTGFEYSSYLEGVFINVLVKKFGGECAIDLPFWTEHRWEGIEWWKKIDKRIKRKMFTNLKNFISMLSTIWKKLT